ncbi:ionotropic receptor 21a isoform X3 [Cryptotermes secundus]|uniref:ionotropic receptor 21a isoform X3 n=1 Tax=Cryptotermes secundus TaxID=105785 RepID=UPI000CD7C70E|nr:ionotropic receptor 21a isoform X3 [Cryptotermes secundus]
MDFIDDRSISSSPSFKNDEKITASLEFQQDKYKLFNHGGSGHRPEEPSNINNIQERTTFLPTEVSSAQQPVLVKLMLGKIKLTTFHGPTSSCRNASDSVEIHPVIRLINYIAERYLYHCISVILYDDFYETQFHILRALLSTYPLTYIHGKVGMHGLSDPPDRCRDFLLLVRDLKTTQTVVGDQSVSRVIVVSQASTWRVREFLSSRSSQNIVNLLVIGNQNQSDSVKRRNADINLYTHDLFVNGLGSSSSRILTAWRCGALTRPTVNLFPDKMRAGFMGHQFLVSAGHQPPFVVKRGQFFNGQEVVSSWDGIEIRLLWLLGEMLNFSISVVEPSEALFLYRAIMGPFHWTVWLTLTLTYLLAIFPIAFSNSHSLKHLLKDPWQVENMFWYVFGTFTNCFTFKGDRSWNNSDKAATRMLIGWYWIFSIIISACYTGSIIAFVTLPLYPSFADNCYEVLNRGFRVGTLSDGGWRHWFNDSADPATTKLFEKMEYLPDLESALYNITTAYYRDYAFLGSWSLLDYIINTNYTQRSEGKRSYLHLGTNCFVPFNVALIFPPQSPHSSVMSQMMLRIIQSGLYRKLKRDMEWDLRRSASGKLLAASSGPSLRAARAEERKLTPEDATGMFLLLGAGFGIAAFILLIETVAWIIKIIKRKFFLPKNNDEVSPVLHGDMRHKSENNDQVSPVLHGNMRHKSENNDQVSPVLHGDMRHKSENNEQSEVLMHDYRDQPGFRERRAYSAGARFKIHEDLDDKSDDRLQYFISLHSVTSSPVTSYPRLKNRRMPTPKPKYSFTVEGEADMSGDEIPEDSSYNGCRKYEEDNSRGPKFQIGNTGDKYFGAEVQEQSYRTSEKNDMSGSLGFRENQDPTGQDTDMTCDDRLTSQYMEQ